MAENTTAAPADLGGAKANIPWRLVTVTEAAELLGLTPNHVRKLYKGGTLPVRYIGERTPRIDIHELYDWLQAQPTGSTQAEDDERVAA
nr:putative DNA binding protein [Shuttle vector pDA71]